MLARVVLIAFALAVPVFPLEQISEAPLGSTSKQVRWQGNTIKLSVSSSLFGSVGIKSQSDVRGALIRALERWEEAANVVFELSTTESSSINAPGASGDGISLITIGTDGENLLAFAKRNSTASAITRVYHEGGSLTECDIALNPSQLFTTDATPGTFDLESVFMHEIGHFLGLSHSLDPSAVMFDGVRRNGGVDSVGVFRSLSSDDRSKARAIYRPSDRDCCTTLSGRLGRSLDTAKSVVWLQNVKDGSLGQLVSPGPGGVFEFQGVARGMYDVVAQNVADDGPFYASTSSPIEIGPVSVKTALSLGTKTFSFDVRRVGLNGQLSKRAVHVVAGNSYRFVIEGPGLRANELRFGSTNAGIVLEAAASDSWDFGKNLSTLAFELSISGSVRPGTYSIFGEDRSGARRYMVGAISVDGP